LTAVERADSLTVDRLRHCSPLLWVQWTEAPRPH